MRINVLKLVQLAELADVEPCVRRGEVYFQAPPNENAVRSVNNLLNRLLKENMVERRKVGKAFKYKVSSRIASLMVSA